MSFRESKIMSLAAAEEFTVSDVELDNRFREILNTGVHGFCFSPYADDQRPGSALSDVQIQSRLDVIKPYAKWVRTFSCTDGNEMIPKIAHENGLKTMVGAWLGNNLDDNEKEITNLIDIARDGYADNIAVGNEVLYRDDLNEEQLISYIDRVKKALPDISIGYVDAYYEFVNRPSLTDACDIVFANCYPYWEGCRFEYSLLYMKDMYHRVSKAAKGKKVIISETGWPSQGTAYGTAEPSQSNALKYFIQTQEWVLDDDVETFYFSSFDEDWKIRDEGDVGPYWGVWDKNGKLKFG